MRSRSLGKTLPSGCLEFAPSDVRHNLEQGLPRPVRRGLQEELDVVERREAGLVEDLENKGERVLGINKTLFETIGRGAGCHRM